MALLNACCHALHIGLRLLKREAWLQPRDRREVADITVRGWVRDRERRRRNPLAGQHPELRGFRKLGSGLQHPRDCVRLAVEPDPRPDSVGAAIEELLPESVSKYDELLTGNAIPHAREHSASGRCDPEHIEERGGDVDAFDLGRFAPAFREDGEGDDRYPAIALSDGSPR